jgi:hypothetical protein
MRKSLAATAAARTTSLNGSRNDASAEVVCLALALAILVLLCRIAAIW